MDKARKALVDRFVQEHIDSVPHLEALLLLYNSRPTEWKVEELAKSLYVRPEIAARILEGLLQRKLIAACDDNSGCFFYKAQSEERDTIVLDLDTAYRREVVRISSMIHSKASAGVLDFARAFKLKKDKE